MFQKLPVQKQTDYMRRWRAANPELATKKSREDTWRMKGIDVTKANEIRANIKHCEICKHSFDNLQVDHCHNKNVIRGMLCPNCNKGLGFFEDNTLSLEEAIIYLDKHS